MSYQDKDIIKVVTGLRRSGKSTLLSLFQNRLLANEVMSSQIQFYNFELPEKFFNKTWDTLYFEIKAKLQADQKTISFLMKFRTLPILKNWLMDYMPPKIRTFTLRVLMHLC